MDAPFFCNSPREIVEAAWAKADENDLTLSQYIRRLIAYDLEHPKVLEANLAHLPPLAADR